MEAPFQLTEDPLWRDAANDLVVSLHALEDEDGRVRLLETLCRGLGQQLYPAFLEILRCIEQSGDDAAKALMSSTLVRCLLSGRLPSGELPSWGGSMSGTDRAFGQVRLLGPIEYACAWYAQQSNLAALTQRQFDEALTSLLSLVSTDEKAAELYRRKLQHDADDPLGGALSNRTRDGLRDLVRTWGEDGPAAATEAFHAQLAQTSLLSQLGQAPRPF